MKQLFMKKCDSILASDTAHSSKELITLLEGIKQDDFPSQRDHSLHALFEIVSSLEKIIS